MSIRGIFRQFSEPLSYFAHTRAMEVLALQAPPMIGIFLGGYSFSRTGVIRAVLLLLGSLLLTTHVFFINDLAGHSTDVHDPRRVKRVFTERGISKRQFIYIATALLILSNVVFAAIGETTVLIGACIAILSLLYSWSFGLGKGTPVIASVDHVLGGTLHFSLGYTLAHSFDPNGLLIGLFFGLVFGAGHLNQEVRDYEGDLLNKIRTNAVVFGPRPTFIASLLLFTAAYGLFVSLAALGILPRFLISSAVLWPVHMAWSLQALRRGLSFETAVWMQRRYRFVFALIGAAIMVAFFMKIEFNTVLP